jgi:hypothetical protein
LSGCGGRRCTDPYIWFVGGGEESDGVDRREVKGKRRYSASLNYNTRP